MSGFVSSRLVYAGAPVDTLFNLKFKLRSKSANEGFKFTVPVISRAYNGTLVELSGNLGEVLWPV